MTLRLHNVKKVVFGKLLKYVKLSSKEIKQNHEIKNSY